MNTENIEIMDNPIISTKMIADSLGMHAVKFLLERCDVEKADKIHPANPLLWDDLKSIEDEENVEFVATDIIYTCPQPIIDYIKMIAQDVQFPVNTAYFHALGVIASACMHNFKSDPFGNNEQSATPCNLFTISVQPPSSAKSTINKSHMSAIFKYSTEYNKDINRQIEVEKRKLASIENAGKKIKDNSDPAGASLVRELERQALEEELAREKLNELKIFIPTITDPTPESIDFEMIRTGGKISVITDEATAIDGLIGKGYGDSSRYGIVLNSWDSEFVRTARVNRVGYQGYATMTIATIAQMKTLKSLIDNGLHNDDGVVQRFLPYFERTLIGERFIDIDREFSYVKIRNETYDKLIHNILNADETMLIYTYEARKVLADIVNSGEAQLKQYESHPQGNFYRSYLGKRYKHIAKIANILHIIQNWCDNGKRSRNIQPETIERASFIFNASFRCYEQLLKNESSSNLDIELMTAISVLKTIKEHLIDITSFRNRIKSRKGFINKPKLTSYIREVLIKDLVKINAIYFHESTSMIYINPRLKMEQVR